MWSASAGASSLPKRLKDYRFFDALPTSNYGKVVKRELRDRLRAETADGRVSAETSGHAAYRVRLPSQSLLAQDPRKLW
jgi:hypothetical protein